MNKNEKIWNLKVLQAHIDTLIAMIKDDVDISKYLNNIILELKDLKKCKVNKNESI